jgi:hypothetical protein
MSIEFSKKNLNGRALSRLLKESSYRTVPERGGVLEEIFAFRTALIPLTRRVGRVFLSRGTTNILLRRQALEVPGGNLGRVCKPDGCRPLSRYGRLVVGVGEGSGSNE